MAKKIKKIPCGCNSYLGIEPAINQVTRERDDWRAKAEMLAELLTDIANSNELDYSWQTEIIKALKEYRGE